ncbi:ABC transporter permease [Aquabacterium sp.]|uniref:ABC transporter permease n=1 Tax=Aquabacterium sp. TaxID=1872578 RepID=UPI0035AED3A4
MSNISDQTTAQQPGHIDWRAFVLPLAIILLWAAATQWHWVNTKLIVPPQRVLSAAFTELGQVDFYSGVGLSLWRDLSGFTAGALAGVAAGVLLGVSRFADKLFGPTFHTLRQISLFAWLPLLSAVLGTGDLSKVIFIGFSAFYPVALATLEGVQGVSKAQAEVAQVYGFTARQFLTRLILPAASPQILSGLKLGLVYAWLATIGAEFLLVNDGHGIGNIVFKGRATFNVELIIFGLFAIGLIGFVLTRIADAAERRFLRWRPANI